MTIYWGKPMPGWVIFSLNIVLLLLSNIFPPKDRTPTGFAYESVSGPEYESLLNDSLPHYQYRKIEDSLNQLKALENASFANSGFYFGDAGVAKFGEKEKEQYFFRLEGYSVDDFVTVENKRNGTILSYPVWDEVGKEHRSGHLESKPINIKYIAAKEDWDGKVLAPISKQTSKALEVFGYVFCFIAIVVLFYVVLFIPFRFLLQLSKDRAFTEENIGSLYLTGWVLIGFALLTSIIKIVAHLCIKSQIPTEIHFSYYAALMDQWGMMVIGLAVLLLAKAFLQGLELKEQQDLTI